MFHRERPVGEYAAIYAMHGIDTTVLASGLPTGKSSLPPSPQTYHNSGNIPEGSRFANHSDFFKDTIGASAKKRANANYNQLKELAENELGCKIHHLALAWVAKQPNTSTVILGASRPEQVVDNLKALEVIPKLTPEVLEKIEKIY